MIDTKIVLVLNFIVMAVGVSFMYNGRKSEDSQMFCSGLAFTAIALIVIILLNPK